MALVSRSALRAQDARSTSQAATPPSKPAQAGNGRGETTHRDNVPRSLLSLSPGGSADERPDADFNDVQTWPGADVEWKGWTAQDPRAWPAWVEGFRDHQVQAVEEIAEAYNRGADVVFLDAPTGAGKTLIGEMARRIVGGKSLYVCHSIGLQEQFVNDFPYASVLKGRANYPTQMAPFPEVTCADCTLTTQPEAEDADCTFCAEPAMCAYVEARDDALHNQIAVVNTAYFLSEANHVGRLGNGRDFIIADEADTLEQILMGTAEFRLAAHAMRRLGIEPPKKGSHAKTVAAWLTDELRPALVARMRLLHGDDVEVVRERNRLSRTAARITQVATEILGDAWVRDYDDTDALILKPVTVDHVGPEWVWKHSKRWLLMSATLVSTDEMVSSLGMAGMNVETVTVPMTFPLEHRRIHAVPVAPMTAKQQATSWPKMATAISKVLERHQGEKVLVHTVSYALASYLFENVVDLHGRPFFTYTSSRTRDEMVEEYRAEVHEAGAVMFAPSLDRGFDFKGDDARVVIVAKIPFPHLGDKQVSARLHTRDGQQWYTVQTIRSLVQMTGRGVRSADDWAVTYVLDSSFLDRLWKKSKRLLPGWWREAVDLTVTKRHLGIVNKPAEREPGFQRGRGYV